MHSDVWNCTGISFYRYNTSDGMFDVYQELSPIPPSTGPITLKLEMEEDTVAAYFCEGGCGGGGIDVYDIRKYAQGDCISMNQCL